MASALAMRLALVAAVAALLSCALTCASANAWFIFSMCLDLCFSIFACFNQFAHSALNSWILILSQGCETNLTWIDSGVNLLMHDQIFQGLCKIDSIASGELTSALRNCASALAFMLFSHSLIFVSSRAYLPPHRKFEELYLQCPGSANQNCAMLENLRERQVYTAGVPWPSCSLPRFSHEMLSFLVSLERADSPFAHHRLLRCLRYRRPIFSASHCRSPVRSLSMTAHQPLLDSLDCAAGSQGAGNVLRLPRCRIREELQQDEKSEVVKGNYVHYYALCSLQPSPCWCSKLVLLRIGDHGNTAAAKINRNHSYDPVLLVCTFWC